MVLTIAYVGMFKICKNITISFILHHCLTALVTPYHVSLYLQKHLSWHFFTSIYNGKCLERHLSLQFFTFSSSCLTLQHTIQYIMIPCAGTILSVCLRDKLGMPGASSLLYIRVMTTA